MENDAALGIFRDVWRLTRVRLRAVRVCRLAGFGVKG